MGGFEVTYSPDPVITSGWPDIVQEFGNYDCVGCAATVLSENYAFGTELVEIATCIDMHKSGGDLENFRFV